MSINITIHGGPVKCSKTKQFLIDEERAKKDLIEKRRKLRLEQVREQSKNFAHCVRQNVEDEKRKQLEKIKNIKEQELKKWREKKICQKQNEYVNCFNQIGLAHNAAANENAKNANEQFDCPPKNNKWNEIRPTEPTPKKKRAPSKNMTYKQFCKEKQKRKQKENLFDSENKKQKNKECSPVSHVYPNVEVKTINVSTSTDDSTCLPKKKYCKQEKSPKKSSRSPNRCNESEAKVPYKIKPIKPRKEKCSDNFVKTPSVILSIDSESEASDVEVDDTHESINMKFTRVTSKTKDSIRKSGKVHKSYVASDYKASESSSEHPTIVKKTRFTQISDLIKQQDNAKKGHDMIRGEYEEQEICSIVKKDTSPNKKSPQKTVRQENQNESQKVKKPKSPAPLKRSSNLKSTSKQCSLNQNNRVQFFDYNNKFEKMYNRPNVVQSEERCSEMNAMQQAEIETQERHAHLQEFENLRQKCDERSQKALEREQIRRDCEALTAKLEAITKGKSKSELISDDAYLFSAPHLKHRTTERQNKMNAAVESVLQRPAIITCPEVEQLPNVGISSDNIEKPRANGVNVASYRKSATTGGDFNTLNSSDSCTSILLNYVNDQSELITKDIKGCDSSEKVNKLKELLCKINCLQQRLLDELEKEKKKETQDPSDMKDVFDDISVLRKERENILLGEEKERKIEQREKRLKKKEAVLQKKLKEFYEMTKNSNNNNVESSTSSSEEKLRAAESNLLSPTKLKTTKPVEIIIKVNEDNLICNKKSPYKSPCRKRSSLINFESRRKIKTPRNKPKRIKTAEKQVEIISSIADGSSSTSYRSPPKEITTKLDTLIEKASRLQDTRGIDINTNGKFKKIPDVQLQNAEISSKKMPTPVKTSRNPLLAHYIQRLLGMSRQSIDMLGVSTSDFETPTSSIINAPTNKSSEFGIDQKDRLTNLQKFIEENYSFLSEVEESIKSTSTITTDDSSLKAIEEIWKRTLKRKAKEKQEKGVCKGLKPILKKKKQTECLKNVEEKSTQEPDNVTHPATATKIEDEDKIELVNKYTELTDNCTQRIAELTEMIKKVREEKQKILEITLSSTNDSPQSTTEYVDFAEKQGDKSVSRSSAQSGKICDERMLIDDSNEKNRLEKNKLTGISRDSGISMSRPLTALDLRESPGMQMIRSPQHEPFEELLKDIPKPSRLSTSPQSTVPQATINSVQKSSESKNKKNKPPSSMTRFSPQFVEDLPHELSTILEVDTSATARTMIASKTDIPTIEENISNLLEGIDLEKITYKKFPTFEEFFRLNQLNVDPETTSKLQADFDELTKLSDQIENSKIEECSHEDGFVRNVSDYSDNVQENINNLIDSLKLLNLSVRKFPTFKEYLKNINASDFSHIKSIIGSESESNEQKDTDENQTHGSCESLPDVVEELLRRNMIRQSFHYRSTEVTDENSSCPKSSSESDRLNEEKSTIENLMKKSQKNYEKIKKSFNKSMSKEGEFTSGVEPIKSSSNSDNIEKDLDKMGLKWASLMLKKSQQSQEVGSSSNSSSIAQTSSRKRSPSKQSRTKKIEIEKENKEHSEENLCSRTFDDINEGRPLNLREFLAKELQKRTQTSSSCTSDDSLASQILRNLLGADESGNNTQPTSTKVSTNEACTSSDQPNRMLTSTPVQTRTTSPSKPSTSMGSQKFFDSTSLSSVRYSQSGSESKSNQENNSSKDNLITPDVRLESDKLTNFSNQGS